MDLNAAFFFELEARLRAAGLDSDSENFDTIKARLSRKEPLDAFDFARQAIYVVLAGGFSQKTAKRIHAEIMEVLKNVGANNHLPLRDSDLFDVLIKMFNNKNKINAVVKIWENREKYRNGYYAIDNVGANNIRTSNKNAAKGECYSPLQQKLDYLSTLPHIGPITANHLARNLGEDIVKYDVWIRRLGVAFMDNVGANNIRPKNAKRGKGECYSPLHNKINNGKLDPDVKAACDEMFTRLVAETGLPRGYIDVVLWKACQNGYIKLKD